MPLTGLALAAFAGSASVLVFWFSASWWFSVLSAQLRGYVTAGDIPDGTVNPLQRSVEGAGLSGHSRARFDLNIYAQLALVHGIDRPGPAKLVQGNPEL